jgi:hypothetical protein
MEDHMKTVKCTIIWGWMIIWGLTMGLNSLSFAAPVESPHASIGDLSAFEHNTDNEMDRFLKAKEQVFKRKWEKARSGFESYLKDYPKGRLRDEGLYWLASSLNMLSKDEKREENIIALKKEASARLDDLIDRHPKSLWRDDGLALRIEIASQLVLMGQDAYTSIIDEAVRTEKKDARQLRMLALNTLVALDETYALPLLQNILNTDTDTEIRKRCVQLLGQHFSDSSFDFLQELAADDPDKEIQKEAESWIDRIQQSRVPVYIKYNIYGSRLVDDSLYNEFPEGQIKTFPLEAEKTIGPKGIQSLISPIFNGKLSSISSSANGAIPYPGFYFQDHFMTVTNRAGDYQLWIKPDELDVSESRIAGVVEFRHRQTNKKTDVSFQLNRGETKLLTTRSGNTISLMILQFQENMPNAITIQTDKSSLPEVLNRLIDISKTIGMSDSGRTTFSDMMGWTVSSSRENWSIDDLTGKTGKYDFGQAEAVSSDPKGWKLVGSLILLTEDKQFLGRKAVLFDPEGKRVASGDEIVVPVDDPQNFHLSDEARFEPAESGIPDFGPFEAKAAFQIKKDVTIRTDREYYEADEFNRNLISFGRSRASLPDRNSTVTVALTAERKWTLLGDIFWIKDKKSLVGFGALVIDPDREVKAYGLVNLPLDDPGAYRVLQGKTWKKGNILEQADERNTRTYYSTQINGVQGWEVWTTLQSGPLQKGGGIDYSLSRAVRRIDDRDWILIGNITLVQEKRMFLGRQAALINSDGDIIFGSEIEVPTENPSGAIVIQK